MEEFFTTVLIELEKEVTDDDGLFSPIVKRFWGKEKIIRKYLATNDGKCSMCSMYPAVNDQNFLTLKIEVPVINASVELSSLIYNYLSESLDQMKLRCDTCCNHDSNCPQTGPCKSSCYAEYFDPVTNFSDYSTKTIWSAAEQQNTN